MPKLTWHISEGQPLMGVMIPRTIIEYSWRTLPCEIVLGILPKTNWAHTMDLSSVADNMLENERKKMGDGFTVWRWMERLIRFDLVLHVFRANINQEERKKIFGWRVICIRKSWWIWADHFKYNIPKWDWRVSQLLTQKDLPVSVKISQSWR